VVDHQHPAAELLDVARVMAISDEVNFFTKFAFVKPNANESNRNLLHPITAEIS
jgi:hypothetical protein